MTMLADISGRWPLAVQRVRLRHDEIDDAVEAVRSLMRVTGTTEASWWLSEHSTPETVEDDLLARGLRTVEGDYLIDGLALTQTAAARPAGDRSAPDRRRGRVRRSAPRTVRGVRHARRPASRRGGPARGVRADPRQQREHPLCSVARRMSRRRGTQLLLSTRRVARRRVDGSVLHEDAAHTVPSFVRAGMTPSSGERPHSPYRRDGCPRRSSTASGSRRSASSVGCTT